MNPAELAHAAWLVAGFDPPTPPPPTMNLMKPRFEIGKIYATAGVTRWAEKHEIDLTRYIRRHHCGDWGDLDAEDRQANEDALEHGARIFSAYVTDDRKIYIVTEYDRSMTTIMLATEY
jgi:hypothetical protein